VIDNVKKLTDGNVDSKCECSTDGSLEYTYQALDSAGGDGRRGAVVLIVNIGQLPGASQDGGGLALLEHSDVIKYLVLVKSNIDLMENKMSGVNDLRNQINPTFVGIWKHAQARNSIGSKLRLLEVQKLEQSSRKAWVGRPNAVVVMNIGKNALQ
jgi:hypothetical protein